MKSFKNYLKPAKAKQASAKQRPDTTDYAPPPAVEVTAGEEGATPRIQSGVSSRRTSRPASIYPMGDFRNSTVDEITDIKCDVMVNWLHQQQLEAMWASGGPGEGVVLKKTRENFTCCPNDLAGYRHDFFDAVRALNVRVRSSYTHPLLAWA